MRLILRQRERRELRPSSQSREKEVSLKNRSKRPDFRRTSQNFRLKREEKSSAKKVLSIEILGRLMGHDLRESWIKFVQYDHGKRYNYNDSKCFVPVLARYVHSELICQYGDERLDEIGSRSPWKRKNCLVGWNRQGKSCRSFFIRRSRPNREIVSRNQSFRRSYGIQQSHHEQQIVYGCFA